MPSARKVGWAQLRVGLLTLTAMIIVATLVFLLTGSKDIFATEATLYTFLNDSAALTEGAIVRLNGIPVGSVSKISLTGSMDPNKMIRLDLKVREDLLSHIPVDSLASISAENVLGTKFINIKKGQSAEIVKPGGTIGSLDTREFDEVVQQGYSLLTALRGILERVDKIVAVVEAGKGSIGKLIVDDEFYDRLVSIVAEGQKISAALASDRGTIGKLIYDDTLYRDVRNSLARLDTLIEGLQRGEGTAGRFLKDPALYEEARQTVGEVRSLLNDLNAGKGSAGKFLKSDELHDRIAGTITRVDNMLDRLNAGQGTLGQLLVNPQLYESVNGATRELNGLLQDFRANPRKFLHIRLSLF
ncbi:MAG: MCE family protein [Bryobacteraceae bacterium]|nr:MCE family protein [Bryobacteraceae bacterium]